MCGIFGVFTDAKWGFSQKQLEVLGQNIIINQFRGVDSTGLFQVDKEGKSDLIKVLGGAHSLFTNEKWGPFQDQIKKNATIVVGHGRAATRGSVKIENAHPFAKTFETGEILKLVHNGTLEQQQDLPDFSKFDVDSEWIAEMMVRFGPKEALGKIRGAMALVWWDEKAKTINFYRNNDRPLHFGTYMGSYEKSFILNSEAHAVRYLAARNGLKSTEKEDVYYFPPFTHASLSLNDLFGGWEKFEKIDPPKPRVYVTETSYYNRRTHFPGRSQYDLYGDADDDEGLASVWSRERSFSKDLEALRRNIYQTVEFTPVGHIGEWHRTTKLPNFSMIREPIAAPYLEGLRKMERVYLDWQNSGFKWWVRITYWDKEKNLEYTTMVGAEEPGAKSSNPSAQTLDWKDDKYADGFVDVGVKKFSPGRKFRWNSRHGKGEVVRHSATIGDSGGHVLKKYKNDNDGAFEIGQQIIMEVRDLVSVKVGDTIYWRVDGLRATPDGHQDACVDVIGYVDKTSELGKELNDVPVNQTNLIAGMVERMELATKEWHLDNNSYVILVLRDMELLSDDEEEPGKTNVIPAEDMPTC